MQLSLPLFSSDVTLITSNVGFFEKEGIVYYLVNGLPVYSHLDDDFQSFRFFVANLISQGLCKRVDVQRAFHVTIDLVNRACKTFTEKGQAGFFTPENRHGYKHKLIGKNLEYAQLLLDKGNNNCFIAKACNVSESAIRYALSKNYLKKKL